MLKNWCCMSCCILHYLLFVSWPGGSSCSRYIEIVVLVSCDGSLDLWIFGSLKLVQQKQRCSIAVAGTKRIPVILDHGLLSASRHAPPPPNARFVAALGSIVPAKTSVAGKPAIQRWMDVGRARSTTGLVLAQQLPLLLLPGVQTCVYSAFSTEHSSRLDFSSSSNLLAGPTNRVRCPRFRRSS